jgi:hypothetical protein
VPDWFHAGGCLTRNQASIFENSPAGSVRVAEKPTVR